MKCQRLGCTIQKAVFAFAKSDKKRYCKKHRHDNMIDVVNPQCAKDGCPKQPKFNMPNEKKGLYCSKHKLDNMMDVVNPQCAEAGCVIYPNYNMPSETKGLYCNEHKLANMIDVKNNKCAEAGCPKQPNYNMPSETKGLYCNEHKLANMIDVKNNKCAEAGCPKQPVFNYSDQTKGLYCSKHKLDSMIDVVHKQCAHKGCIKNPNFNYSDQKQALYCNKHKLEGMIDVISKKCAKEGCIITPIFNYKGCKGGIYCVTHAPLDMENVVSPRCVLCNLIRAIPHYDNHCYGCYSFKYPDDPRVRNYKTKEQAIMQEIKKAYPEIILDSRVAGGCSKRRPDGFIELKEHSIIVEIDENQHKGYDPECEHRRMMEISRDLAFRPIVFIRINPDSYKCNGKRYDGAFKLTKATGALSTRPKLLQKRISAALDMIGHYHKIVPSKTITVESLFFDEYDPESVDALMAQLKV